MIIYSVNCVVDVEIAEAWESFFIEKHLDDLVQTGYFTGYSFRKQIEPNATNKVSFTSEYFAPNMASLEKYQQTVASTLKQEVSDLFAGKYSCSRVIYEERKQKLGTDQE